MAHHLPHRTRLRVPDVHRGKKTMRQLNESLLKVPGVKSVKVNERTGSIVVHHDEDHRMLEAMGEAISNLGLDSL